MDSVKVVKIVDPNNPNDYLWINESSFDANIHTLHENQSEDSEEASTEDTSDTDENTSNPSPEDENDDEGQESPSDSDENQDELKTTEELEQLEWHELKGYANQFGITDRSRDGLMRELAEANKIAPSE